MSDNNYNAQEITVLEGLEAVRKRPGMYIGNTDKEGLHSLLREILDNSVDEFMAGHADKVLVCMYQNGACLVADNGRGVPTDIHSKTGKTALETIMTVLHAGGKFDQNNYKFSGGLHGVGASVVNALSDKMEVWVLRNDIVSYQYFSKGKVQNSLETYPKAELFAKYPELINKTVWKDTGTIIKFKPDIGIFETVEFDYNEIKQTLEKTAYLNKSLQITLELENSKNASKTINPEIINILETLQLGAEF